MSIQVTSTTDVQPASKVEVLPKEGGVQKHEGTQSAPESQQAQEQNSSSESDTEETEDEAVDQENDSESDDGEVKEDDQKKPKKKGGFQRRIDKLNARYADERQRREELEQRLAQLERSGEKAPQKVEEGKSQEGKPNPDSFETHAEYVEALADWKIEQREKKRAAEAEKAKLETEHQAKLKTHFDRVKSFAETVDDFEEAIEAVDDIPVPAALQELIISSENGPELLYELAKNREEFARISKLPPLACARELGRLELKIATKSSDEKKPEPNKITKAPKPIDPVGKNAKAAVTKSLDDPNLTQAEYERLRREQMKRRQA